MTKIKLVDGTIIDAVSVDLVNGVLEIATKANTVEGLAEIFSNKKNTSLITLMTVSEVETGFMTGFTSFAGIFYAEDGVKIVKMFQPIDATEARIANAEGIANQAIEAIKALSEE